ncbi:MAG: hypothetical protein H0W01_06790 [Pseudonocardiales bacterium]|nr:hypothetical protein [Pseudonocardiales bacterium]
MTAWFSILVPLLVMLFALAMERIESRLRDATVRQEELDDLLDHPQADEVGVLFRQGTADALEVFRRRGNAPQPVPATGAPTVSS